jgi:sterol desaturase/sphingolipid hydroxylase (fatty acid hydroxylase superfamily)
MVALFLGQAIIGWLLADLIGAVIHWWEDRVAREDMPFIGPEIISFNRLHHRRQMAFTVNSFRKRNQDVWVLVSIIGLTWLAISGPSVVWAFAVLGGLLSAQVHLWAHQPIPAPHFVRVLQQIGIFQSPQHHASHHRHEDRGYAPLTNLLNPVLDGLKVWDHLEAALTSAGLKPNKGTL